VIYRFGEFELDESKGELRKGGHPLAVQPKPLALLTILVAEHNRIVSNEELLEHLWPDESVTPSSLARAVSVARGAIEDTGRGKRIRSYTRRGYRFVDHVVELRDADSEDVAEGEPRGDEIPFVGRTEPLGQLRDRWRRVMRGRGAVSVLRGRAGLGKTRLAESFASEVERSGAYVLRGRSLEEEGEPPFWVWAQVLRNLYRVDPACLEEPGLADSGELSALLPELARVAPPASQLPAEQRRFVFFDAFARTLRHAAQNRPVLVIFEDLHWADPASQRLLEHLVFDISDAALMIVVTTREEEENPAIARSLATLRRQDHFESISLGELSQRDLADLVERWAGKASDDLAERLHQRTGGVPLFVREAIRRLDIAAGLENPERVNELFPAAQIDWVREALAGLSEPCAVCLGAASAAGRAFSLRLVADVWDGSREETLDVLDEAVRLGVVEIDPDAPTEYRFVHDLFREAAYDALTPGTRARWHDRIANSLERKHAEDLDAVIAELAFHRHRALALGDSEPCFAYASRAAELAFHSRAYEQAVLHWKQALAALDQLDAGDPTRRLGSLLGLGEASRLAGDREGRRAYLGEAMVLARKLGRHEDFASAAIGLCDLAEWGVKDQAARAALHEALDGIGDTESELEARILTRIGYYDAIPNRAAAEQNLRRAVSIARELGASDPLEEALYTLHLMLGGPDDKAERLAILEELRGTAAAARDRVASVIAVLDVACDFLEVGDRKAAEQLRREADLTAGTPAHPLTVWHRQVYDTGWALMEGRMDEVEGRADAARRLGLRMQHPYAVACHVGQTSQLGVDRGAMEEVLARLEPALAATEGPSHWVRARVARAQFATGREAEARALFEGLLSEGLDGIPRNLRWIGTLVELAHCAADLRHAQAAEPIREMLAPFEGHHSVLPVAIIYGGPVHWALGRLHEVCGRPGEAELSYRDGLEAVVSLGARPAEAWIRLSLGRLHMRRKQRSAGREALQASRAIARELGLRSVESSAQQALER
jgi:DNA-binding winged helix-turn-helix (wHTH) protein/tetratricopeptide (TPR) repeat protein